jgi:hypothetical protein
MLNYCFNTLTIEGSVTDVYRFVTDNEPVGEPGTHSLSFNALIPVPVDFVNKRGWTAEHWGTKDEPYDAGDKWDFDTPTEDGHTFASITLDTAWVPPLKWLETVGAQYPTLDFCLEYSEPGMKISGMAQVIEGIFSPYVDPEYVDRFSHGWDEYNLI